MAASASAAPAPSPSPSPSPTQSSPASTAPPPIALQPPGSSTTGPLIGIAADDGAKIVATKWLDARTVDITMTSPAVGTNVVTRVFVPVGWSQASPTTYPLTLMLHGGSDDYTSWDRETTLRSLSSAWKTVVAMPDAGRQATYTNFFNGGKYGNVPGLKQQWETFHTKELIQVLERAFHASDQRVVAGLSSGGYGSMAYATRQPKLWKYAASYSGAISIRGPLTRNAVLAADASYGGDTFARFGLPFINENIWAAADPYTNASKLRGMGVFLASGYTGLPAADDVVEWTPLQAVELLSGNVTVQFDLKLKMLGIPHVTDLYALGEHAWVSWQRELEKSWPLMMKAINAQKA